MTENEFVEIAETLDKDPRDPELYHISYDDAIIQFLREAGYTKVAERFSSARKHFWYA